MKVSGELSIHIQFNLFKEKEADRQKSKAQFAITSLLYYFSLLRLDH